MGHDPQCTLMMDDQCIVVKNGGNIVSTKQPTNPVGTDYFSGFSEFERNILNNFSNAEIEGKRAADFMINNDIHVGYGSTRYPNWFSAWWDADNRTVTLDEKDFDSNNPNPNDPFLLNIVAHELDHINITYQFGSSLIPAGLTKYGEIRGWQIGFAVQYNFTQTVPRQGSNMSNLISLDLNSPDVIARGSSIIYEYHKNVSGGWIYSLFYSLLPSYPWSEFEFDTFILRGG